jgi:hypothetical protein
MLENSFDEVGKTGYQAAAAYSNIRLKNWRKP